MHGLGDIGHADKFFLDDLAGAGTVRDGALWEAERIEGRNPLMQFFFQPTLGDHYLE